MSNPIQPLISRLLDSVFFCREHRRSIAALQAILAVPISPSPQLSDIPNPGGWTDAPPNLRGRYFVEVSR